MNDAHYPGSPSKAPTGVLRLLFIPLLAVATLAGCGRDPVRLAAQIHRGDRSGREHSEFGHGRHDERNAQSDRADQPPHPCVDVHMGMVGPPGTLGTGGEVVSPFP